jgi:ABC-type polysaccharide/polyol phosphate export permease
VTTIDEEGPPPEIRYRRALHLGSSLRELRAAKHVMLSIGERDLRSRYSQMALGFAWDIIGPVALTIVITFFLSRVNGIKTYGLPRPLFVYVAILPWTFFQGSVSSGGTSLVANNSLLNKVYAPREVFPLANIGEQVIDCLAASSALFVLMAIFQRAPKITALWLPIPLLIALIFTIAVTLVVSGLTVYFRDMRQAIPVALQLGLFFNPIFYDFQMLSPSTRVIFSALNPLSAAIDGVRRCVFYGQAPRLSLTLIAGAVACLELLGAYIVFKQMETGFADVA